VTPEGLRTGLEGLLAPLGPPGGFAPDAPLLTSGLVDSLALLDLAAWIEMQVGKPIDPATLNLPEDWDTIDRIVGFIGRRRGT
jgi:hypothetical protein